jgi:bifunctional non-homologous end joining protein LigD
VRPTSDARVSTPVAWDEVLGCDPGAFTVESVPDRFARGDPWAGMDHAPGSLEVLLELADEHASAGFGDAPWPPHYEKTAGEPPRVQPSKRRMPAPKVRAGIVPPPAPGKSSGPTGRRRSTMPLIEIARAATQQEAQEGFERWKARHADIVPYLEPPDVLVDSMRGRSSTWTRIRVNLKNVPDDRRPEQEPLEVDYDPWAGVEWPVSDGS